MSLSVMRFLEEMRMSAKFDCVHCVPAGSLPTDIKYYEHHEQVRFQHEDFLPSQGGREGARGTAKEQTACSRN